MYQGPPPVGEPLAAAPAGTPVARRRPEGWDATPAEEQRETFLTRHLGLALVVLGLYIICLAIVSRAAGLEGGLGTGCLATGLGVVVSAAALVPLGWLVGDYLDQTMWSLVAQGVGLAGLCLGVKLVFNANWPRALLTVLLTSVLVVTVAGVALVILF